MAKKNSQSLTRFSLTVRQDGRDLNVTHKMPFSGAADVCMLKAARLNALTQMITGDGFEAFNSMCDELKSDLLMVIDDLADEVAALAAASYEFARTDEPAAAEASHG